MNFETSVYEVRALSTTQPRMRIVSCFIITHVEENTVGGELWMIGSCKRRKKALEYKKTQNKNNDST